MQLIIADVIPKFVTIHSKQHVPSGYYSVHFPVFYFSFSAFRRNDFGVEPVPSLQASGKLFWVPQNTTCHVRLNMNFSSEKSKDSVPTASLRKNPFAGILITFCILKNASSRILERCNRMTYRVTDRQQAAMIVPIRKIYRYFAACQHVSGSSVIQVCIRYGVHG